MSFQLISDPWFWFLAVVAVLLTGISKSGVGGGAGGVSTPLMSMAISPVAAAAIMLPVLCVMDLFGIRAFLWSPRLTLDARQLADLKELARQGMTLDLISRGTLNPKDQVAALAAAVPDLRIVVVVRDLGRTVPAM